MRKITILLIVVLATSLFAGEFPKVDIHGRFLLEMDYENNFDWTEFKDNDFNDKNTYTQGRLDLTFDSKISEDIKVLIHTRVEGDSTSKWFRFNGDSDNKLKDAKFKVQQAYVQYDNLFLEGFSMHLGQRLWNYGGGHILGAGDYVGGMAMMVKMDNIWFDFHAINMCEFENNEYNNIEEDHADKILGVIGGMNKVADMLDVQAYFFRRGENVEVAGENKTECDARNILGFRGDAELMDGMLMPYLEFAMQMGANDVTKQDYSGMLVDVGLNAKLDLGFGKLMPRAEIFMRTGDDNGSDDEIEAFRGIGLGNVEVGYNLYNIHSDLDVVNYEHGLMMVNIGSDFTPEMCEKASVGFDFFMFNDNSTDYKDANNKEISGENMWNEFDIFASYQVHKKAKLYTGMAMLMPNKDYPGFGEDSAMALWFGTEVKW